MSLASGLAFQRMHAAEGTSADNIKLIALN